jgi:hypothetical protein
MQQNPLWFGTVEFFKAQGEAVDTPLSKWVSDNQINLAKYYFASGGQSWRPLSSYDIPSQIPFDAFQGSTLDPDPINQGQPSWSSPHGGGAGGANLPFFASDPGFLDLNYFSPDFAQNFSLEFMSPLAERLGPIYHTEYHTPGFTPSRDHGGKDLNGATRLPTIDVAGKAQPYQVENPVPKVEDGFHVERGKDGYFYKVEDGSHLELGNDGQYHNVQDGFGQSNFSLTFDASGAFGDFFSGFGDFFSGFGDFGASFDQFALQDYQNWLDWQDWQIQDFWDEWSAFPVVLDLNGDGIKIDPLTSSNNFFDMAGDGYQHRTAWVGAGDAVLAFDANNDGLINQKNEIVFTEWDPTADSDMQALLNVFDSNSNGKLDAGDAKFSQFKLLVTNANGTRTVQMPAKAANDNARKKIAA